MRPLSVLIPAFNSERTIVKTLESVKWADEIIVCDSWSTDRTLEIAAKYGAKIIQHEYINSALQKNWAIPQCTHEWVLIVDTDEVVEDELRDEIRRVLEKDEEGVNAYRIPRKNFIYGKWMRYGGIYPDYQIRFFRKGKALYETREVHAHMIVEGRAQTFEGHLLHEGFKDLRTWAVKLDRYIHYETDEMMKQGKRFSLVRVTLYPAAVFFQSYILQKGFLEGYRGFLLASISAFYYFMMYARLHERQRPVG
jgi:glycosyltransferase involved in cell wall biosynthesis